MIVKVQEAHAGDYKVQCRSGRQSNTVRIEVLGKYVKKLLNLFMGFKVGSSSPCSFFFSSHKYKVLSLSYLCGMSANNCLLPL